MCVIPEIFLQNYILSAKVCTNWIYFFECSLPFTVQSILQLNNIGKNSQEIQRCNRNNVLSFPKISIISATGGPTYSETLYYSYIFYILMFFTTLKINLYAVFTFTPLITLLRIFMKAANGTPFFLAKSFKYGAIQSVL